MRLAKSPPGRADGRKQPVELLYTYRCAKASTESCDPARPRPAPVAFRVVFAHPQATDATVTGTKGDFEGEITSIEASFDFHP